MIRSLEFRNFKVLRDAKLPLGPFTLLLGPNGSGKSTVLQALQAVQRPQDLQVDRVFSAGTAEATRQTSTIEVTVRWGDGLDGMITLARWCANQPHLIQHRPETGDPIPDKYRDRIHAFISRIRCYSIDAGLLPSHVAVRAGLELGPKGEGLAGVLDQLKDRHSERFRLLNEELTRWLPEFSGVTFDTPVDGSKAVELITKEGEHRIPASELSQGTLIALAILTLAYAPTPPSLVGFEEPDRGIHPRLLRDVRDALYRLSHPEAFGESRPPVQVIATTHSPYMLDLFRDHPEEIVLASRTGLSASFQRLSDRTDLDELLRDARLGDVWYTGILGGIPSEG